MNYKRKSDYHWFKEFRKDEGTIRDIINGRRISFYNAVIKDRVFNHNMIEGLCYGKFYGRQKIIFKRKDFLEFKKWKKRRSKIFSIYQNISFN